MKNNSTFDINIGVQHQEVLDNYKFKYGRKVVTWENNFPFCYSYKYNTKIRFHLLHFQGPAKYLMAHFYKGNNFSNKIFYDIKFFMLNILAYIYKTLRIRYRFAWIFKIIFKFNKK